ncbi:MAG TPA: type II secretion system F family protein [Alphaproteobacteria bacterium]|nr:type II secretion system F family protein [Alphaproteobacteria bacterium]HRK97488.1 type II secretion system F family protein [Alphaproteobacteria bacterium]
MEVAIQPYKYKAYNAKGRPIRGVVSAANEVDLYNQLQSAGMELVSCSPVSARSGAGFALFRPRVRTRDLIQFFMHLEQMQGAGVPMLDSLADVRDSSENQTLKDIMTDVHRSVSEGSSLSESMAAYPKVFANLYISLIQAGEETGDLRLSYTQLIKYLKWIDEMQSKIKKATRYPIILLVVVVMTITVMMGFVVPEIIGFIKNLGQELPFYTTALVATSEFFQSYWWAVMATPVALFFAYRFIRKSSEGFAYQMDTLFLRFPIMGPLIRKISIARYSQTFGALFSSGIDVLNCLRAAQQTVTNLALLEALDVVLAQVQTGSPLSSAFGSSGEFPTMVTRMIKIGEESGNLTPVLNQVSEFYTKDVDEAVQGLITMIEPMLTLLLGVMILWIAVAVFGPIYGSFEHMEM